jgi:hypothetical protein
MRSTIAILLLALMMSSCNDYSSGVRQGRVMKISKKGFKYKTWECTIDQGGMRPEMQGHMMQMVQNTFKCSIDAERRRGEDENTLAHQLEQAMYSGKNVQIHYNQEAGTNWCGSRGETQYYIDSVKIMD